MTEKNIPSYISGRTLAVKASVTTTRDGPYRLEGEVELVDHLGVAIPFEVSAELCRCGKSKTKPFCDNSHLDSGFTGSKDHYRVLDHVDLYEGQQATVFDNRGLCAHSGFCTDRLNSVFHLDVDPFVTPSGARLDEVIRAVRKCPSGALGIGFNGVREQKLIDTNRAMRVEVCKDGPYRVTGGVALFDETGQPTALNDGASFEHYSLCRCGASLNKPFCSGMHWSVGFTDPAKNSVSERTLFEWAGGYPALLDMTTIFYSKYVPEDPVIAPLFANMSPDHPERVAAWLSEVFGGPKFYSERYGGYARMISQHVSKNIKPDQRARWASLMVQSADDAGLPTDPEFRAAFIAYIEWGSRIAVENSTPGAKPPPNMPVPRWWWVCDAAPGSRQSALAPQQQEPTVWSPPPTGTLLDYERHIKPLFRPMDRNSMRFAFDLWSAADVTKHGDAILLRLESGTMPCDGPWHTEKIAIFKAWLKARPAP